MSWALALKELNDVRAIKVNKRNFITMVLMVDQILFIVCVLSV
jgi:hypothetical protein